MKAYVPPCEVEHGEAGVGGDRASMWSDGLDGHCANRLVERCVAQLNPVFSCQEPLELRAPRDDNPRACAHADHVLFLTGDEVSKPFARHRTDHIRSIIASMSEFFAPRWLEMAERLFPRIGKRDGLPEGDLKAAEKRLGFALPAGLRAMYGKAGRRHDLHEAWDRLVSPKNLIMVNKALVFYEEHDRTAAWAIRASDLAAPDPPVVSARNEPPFKWEADHDTLDEFFFTELLWTHVRSEPSVVLEQRPDLGGWDEIDLTGCHWDIRGCYAKGGVVVMERGDASHETVYAGATSEDDLRTVLSLPAR
jgi:hypothetical protein